MTDSLIVDDEMKADAEALRKMKRLATSFLVVVSVVFVIAKVLEKDHPWLSYVAAAAEGGMVGALADWFAVTALFRHPLGLKIPHTAIVPKRKRELGVRLGEFMRKHFLVEEVVRPKLAELQLAHMLFEWLSHRDNARTVVKYVVDSVGWALNATDDVKLRRFFLSKLSHRLHDVDVATFARKILNLLTVHGKHEEMFEKMIDLAEQAIEKLKPTIRSKVDEEIPVYLGFLRKRAFHKIIDGLERNLEEMRADSTHELRNKFDHALSEFMNDLDTSPKLRSQVQGFWNEFLSDPTFQKYLGEVWMDFKEGILRHTENSESTNREAWVDGIARTARSLRNDETLCRKFEEVATASISTVVSQHGAKFSGFVADEVDRWDAEMATNLFERQIGRDLQWIRINGTLVGALAGLVIHWIGETLIH